MLAQQEKKKVEPKDKFEEAFSELCGHDVSLKYHKRKFREIWELAIKSVEK